MTDIHPFTISTIGGGFNGSAVNYHIIRHLIHHYNGRREMPAVHLNMFDKGGRFYAGEPYETSYDDDYILNQPAALMSLDHRKPMLCASDLNVAPAAFVPRNRYNIHLKKQVDDAIKDASLRDMPLSFSPISDNVTRLDNAERGFQLTTLQQPPILSDVGILMEGHPVNQTFVAFKQNPLFISGHVSTSYLQERLQSGILPGVATIGGLSQTGQDGQKRLNSAGYTGLNYMIADGDPEIDGPWPFHDHYRKPKPGYEPRYLTPEHFQATQNWSYDGLKKAYFAEINEAQAHGFDVGHILRAIPFDDLATGPFPDADLARFKTAITRKRSRPTPPEKFAEYQHSLSRIRFVEGRLKPDNIEELPNGFALHDLLPNGKPLKVGLIIDGAPYDRHALSPLTQNAIDIGAMTLGVNGRVTPGQQKNPRLFANLPNCYEMWGVETFRECNYDIARAAANIGLGLQALKL